MNADSTGEPVIRQALCAAVALTVTLVGLMVLTGSLWWAPDSDQDGIADEADACPAQPEDWDGFEDGDGCSDPDNDQDGVADKADRCPGAPEDPDGHSDDDGCPDPDNDGDGTPDVLDACPDEAGAEGATDGCPTHDEDGDGLIDDLCPSLPEDLDGFQDEDGCPDVIDQSGYWLVEVPAGTFKMGCAEGTGPACAQWSPLHDVTLSRALWMGATEVTQKLYNAVTDAKPWLTADERRCERRCDGDDCIHPRRPVMCTNWLDALAFCNTLSTLEGLNPAYKIDQERGHVRWDQTANGYRLPTEAEWEYAAKAGQDTRYSGSNRAKDVAWPSNHYTGTVARKRANAWEIYDMSGNVGEWVWDAIGPLSKDPQTDPVGAEGSTIGEMSRERIVRGGSFFLPENTAVHSRLSVPAQTRRDYHGFRVVRPN